MQFHTLRSRAVLISLVLLLVVALNVFSKSARNAFYSLSSPALSFFWELGSGGESEKELLHSQVNTLLQELARLEAAEQENEQLRKAMNLDISKKFEILEARVIAKDPGEDSILINKGGSSGVETGMSVITASEAVVGRVSEVFSEFSKVLLLSHPEVSFDAKVASKNTFGLVKGEGRFRSVFSLVPQDASLQVGDTIVTTKLGQVFPENLIVGEVETLLSNPADPFQSALLKLFSLEENLTMLFVITK